MLCYFDSSVLLAILFDEERKTEALDLWATAGTRISSVLLKLETITVLRRTYEHNKARLNPSWQTTKAAELGAFLQEVNYRTIDQEIENLIFLKKELAQCRTLDAIHVATALEMSRLVSPGEFALYTFDSEMAKLAKRLKFNTNKVTRKLL